MIYISLVSKRYFVYIFHSLCATNFKFRVKSLRARQTYYRLLKILKRKKEEKMVNIKDLITGFIYFLAGADLR